MISVPSASATPATRRPSQRIAATGAVGAHLAAVVHERPRASASVSAPLPPTGRPTRPTWRIAYDSAPSPVPGVSGLMPHTIGPIDRGRGRRRASWRKNDRMHVGRAAPAPAQDRRHAGQPAAQAPGGSAPAAVGGSVAAARISSTAGQAARR